VGAQRPSDSIRGRIAHADGSVAGEWKRLVAYREADDRPFNAMDALIAATAQVHGLTLVTRNVSEFKGKRYTANLPCWSRAACALLNSFRNETVGRRVGRLHGLSITGSLGILIQAKQRGSQITVRAAIARMRQHGIWLSAALEAECLRAAGE
jgi:hypothetical protein